MARLRNAATGVGGRSFGGKHQTKQLRSHLRRRQRRILREEMRSSLQYVLTFHTCGDTRFVLVQQHFFTMSVICIPLSLLRRSRVFEESVLKTFGCAFADQWHQVTTA